MEHIAKIKPGSLQRTARGGLAFVVECCDGQYSESRHWEQPAAFSMDELDQKVALVVREVAIAHANHDAVDQFIQRIAGAHAK